jgi:hypothetical protein
VERLDIFLPNVHIQNNNKFMMKEILKNTRRTKPNSKGRSTRRRPFTLKRTSTHLKKVLEKQDHRAIK